MECIEAQKLLSEAIDTDVPDGALAEARAHCAGCEACERFLRVTTRAASLPSPTAPPALIDALVALGAEESAAIRAAAAAAAEAPVAAPDEPATTTQTLPLPSRWAPRFTAFASIAAVILIAVVATGIGLGGMLTSRQGDATLSSAPKGGESDSYLASPPATDSSAAEGANVSAAVSAPAYVAVDGVVYSPTGPREIEESSLVSASPVLTALGTGAEPISLPAFRIAGEPERAVLGQVDGTYLGLSAVTRTFGGKRFVLTSGSIITAYGQWPSLPTRFATPSEADGTPTFSFFGKDDIGVLIYVPSGGRPTEGFAVAPGSAPEDPAAGNPNWTWWQAE